MANPTSKPAKPRRGNNPKPTADDTAHKQHRDFIRTVSQDRATPASRFVVESEQIVHSNTETLRILRLEGCPWENILVYPANYGQPARLFELDRLKDCYKLLGALAEQDVLLEHARSVIASKIADLVTNT